MINVDDVRQEKTKEHNPNWSQLSDHQYTTLIIRLWIWKNKFII